MLITALFTFSQAWKQLKCAPQMNKQVAYRVDVLAHTHTHIINDCYILLNN